MLKALIFDFDGLILDTELPDFESWQECFREHGVDLTFEVWADCIGRASGHFDPYQHLEELVGWPLDREAIRSARRRRYLERVHAQPVLPGVEPLIAAAREEGLGLAIASSGTRDWVIGHLDRLGLLGHFLHVICGTDVRHAKPDPELYLTALERLGVEPTHAVALEDSPNGVLAARRAGLFCVAVPNALTGRLPLDHADLRVTSLADLTLDDLRRHLTHRWRRRPAS